MRILVASGADFVGSRLRERPLVAGCGVLAVDSHLTGRRADAAHLPAHPRFELLRQGIAVPPDQALKRTIRCCRALPPTLTSDRVGG